MSNSHILDWSRSRIGRMPKEELTKQESISNQFIKRLNDEIATGKLPFLSMPYFNEMANDINTILPKIQKYKHMLVLGIGGSALGARAIQKAFSPEQDGPNHSGPSLWIADNVSAEQFETLLNKLDPKDTIVVCISKSGGTIETLSQYFLIKEWLKNSLQDNWTSQMIVITDKEKGYLRQEANNANLFSLEVPDNLGGRYSALSSVGMLPAAYLGINWKDIMQGAKQVASSLVKDPQNILTHPSMRLAHWAKSLEDNDYSQLIFFCYIPQWSYFGFWFAQLWAESLGKQGKGIMPVPATGVTDQHSVNQMFLDGPRNKACIFLTCQQQEKGRSFNQDLPDQWSWLKGKPFASLLDAEALGTRMALCKNNVPLVHLNMCDKSPKAAGAMMMLLEAATVFTGWLLDINPLDQPAVELGKRLANAKLGAKGYSEEETDLESYLSIPTIEQSF